MKKVSKLSLTLASIGVFMIGLAGVLQYKAFQIEDVVPKSEATYLTVIVVVAIVLVALFIVVFVKFKTKKNNNIWFGGG